MFKSNTIKAKTTLFWISHKASANTSILMTNRCAHCQLPTLIQFNRTCHEKFDKYLLFLKVFSCVINIVPVLIKPVSSQKRSLKDLVNDSSVRYEVFYRVINRRRGGWIRYWSCGLWDASFSHDKLFVNSLWTGHEVLVLLQCRPQLSLQT